MRITIVQGAFFPVPPLLGGAVEKVWWALGAEFARRGHQVVHLSRRYPSLPNRERTGGVEHFRLSGFAAPRSLLRLKLLDLLYSLRVRVALPPADILVTNTFWLPMLVHSRRPGRVYVHVARYPRGQMKLYGRAARLQAVSAPIAAAIIREAPHLAEKVRSVPLLVSEPSPAASSTPVERDPRRLLYVGRVHPEKGLHLLLRAMLRLHESGCRDWRLSIVGPAETHLGGGGRDYLLELQRLAAPLGALVEFAGPVFDEAALAGHYRRAGLFIYPSLAEFGETFGLAPLEAMALGCATVVSNLACFQDFLTPTVHGRVFDHRNADPAGALMTELQACLADPNAARELAVRGEIRARDFFLEPVATLYLRDFESLLAPP